MLFQVWSMWQMFRRQQQSEWTQNVAHGRQALPVPLLSKAFPFMVESTQAHHPLLPLFGSSSQEEQYHDDYQWLISQCWIQPAFSDDDCQGSSSGGRHRTFLDCGGGSAGIWLAKGFVSMKSLKWSAIWQALDNSDYYQGRHWYGRSWNVVHGCCCCCLCSSFKYSYVSTVQRAAAQVEFVAVRAWLWACIFDKSIFENGILYRVHFIYQTTNNF